MNGFAHGLNSGLLHISARMDVMASQNYPVSSSLKITAMDKVWMLSMNKRQLEALDRTPVSILRFSISDDMYDKPSDAHFAKASFNNYMVAEGTNFVHCTNSDPFLALGIPPKDLEWFTERSFIERIGICDHEAFEVRIRVDTNKLQTENTKEAALTNTCLVLSTELNYRSRNDPDSYQGYINNYGTMAHETQIQMRDMLMAGIRTAIVSAATSQSKREVGNCARRIQKSIPGDKIGSRGRIQNVENVFKRSRAQSNLFMLIYRMVGINVRHELNAKAAIYAYNQFSFMLSYMGYNEDEMLDINDCFVLANGTLSGVLMWTRCTSCNTNYLQLPDKPARCHYCRKR